MLSKTFLAFLFTFFTFLPLFGSSFTNVRCLHIAASRFVCFFVKITAHFYLAKRKKLNTASM